MKNKSLMNLTAVATAFFTVGEGQAGNESSSEYMLCNEPLPVVGITVDDDGAFFNLQAGGDIHRIMIGDGPETPDGVVMLDDMVEHGLISNGMADFYRTDFQAAFTAMEKHRDILTQKFDIFSFLDTGLSQNLSLSIIRANAGSSQFFERDVTKQNDLETLMDAYDSDVMNAVTSIFEITRNVMFGHAQIASKCSIQTTQLVSDNGTLRPKMRPE